MVCTRYMSDSNINKTIDSNILPHRANLLFECPSTYIQFSTAVAFRGTLQHTSSDEAGISRHFHLPFRILVSNNDDANSDEA